MPPLLLSDLPTTKQLVKATVLAMGIAALSPGCGDDGGTTDGATDGAVDSAADTEPAPTCGPCCHGGADCDSSVLLPDSGVEAGPGDASSDAAGDAASDATGDAAGDAA